MHLATGEGKCKGYSCYSERLTSVSRTCPGKELVGTTLWLEIAMSLASFDITRKLDAGGKEIISAGEYSSSIIW